MVDFVFACPGRQDHTWVYTGKNYACYTSNNTNPAATPEPNLAEVRCAACGATTHTSIPQETTAGIPR